MKLLLIATQWATSHTLHMKIASRSSLRFYSKSESDVSQFPTLSVGHPIIQHLSFYIESHLFTSECYCQVDMVDSSTVQDSQKKATKPPPCRGRLSLPRGLGKCFIHLCCQMLQMLQFLLGKSPTKMANSHQQMTPPKGFLRCVS